MSVRQCAVGAVAVIVCMSAARGQTPTTQGAPSAAVSADPAASVNPFIGSANGGNTFPGAVLPFGMLAWSPENTRGDATRAAAPGGYQYDVHRIRGFSLTHLSGTGCRGASGDVPFMPITVPVTSSPAGDAKDALYASDFDHAAEQASPGFYQVRLASGVNVELTAAERAGMGRFAFPPGQPATLLLRVARGEVGSSDADVTIDAASRTVTGSVTSGNFCGYLNPIGRRSYYTLHFVAVFDRAITSAGTWMDDAVHADEMTAHGGTTYGSAGYPEPGKGSGAWVTFGEGGAVTARVGISYVSAANARANLDAEIPGGTFETTAARARAAWNGLLGRIDVSGGTATERRIFYTALYHALLHMNLSSDVNGEYTGFDAAVHRVTAPQRAQYANFSGWDVYRTQVQLVALLDPAIAADMAQSLLNQARENGGVWDRWTHQTGATHVMEGDPSPATVASIAAFGGTTYDMAGALASLTRAATVPTPLDLSNDGCNVLCQGQRPSLDAWLSIHYVPTVSNAWGGAGETLEDVSADFALSQLASRLGETDTAQQFLARSGYWRNIFNPSPTLTQGRGGRGGRAGGRGGARGGGAAPATPPVPAEAPQPGGYIQNRNADGTWPPLSPSASSGFAEGSSVQYTWMIPFDVAGLFDAMGGTAAASARLDAFFHTPDGAWALTRAGGLHAEMNNEPSVGTPWLYLFAGQPYKSQEIQRDVLTTLWQDAPNGIPGNDDLGAMSSWFVWTAMGLYPQYPGRAELLVGTPLFPRVVVRRANGRTIAIDAAGAAADVPYVRGLRVNGQATTRAWLPASFLSADGRLELEVGREPNRTWGASPQDAPPSFPPASRSGG